ncbi:MAG: hypothetical protein MUQ10_09905, partial [Anaerolineae bacterium]|nr:hypothetical protein [Anaerolineae bacterium]
MGVYGGLFLLSASSLAFEIVLTRIFSVGQFYHFAFMIVSLALLGYGASGTALAIFPKIGRRNRRRTLAWLSRLFSLVVVSSYLFTQYVPFDSFRIALEWRQAVVLSLHYLALALPFFCSGLATALVLAADPQRAGRTYAVNLVGSGVGCLLAVAFPALVGAQGVVLLVAAMGTVAAAAFSSTASRPQRARVWAGHALTAIVIVLCALAQPGFLEIRLSPYKSLSYVLLYPDAEVEYQRWNGFSRVDVVRSEAIRNLPGRGFLCADLPPPQMGLTVDGDDLSPISHLDPGFENAEFTNCLLTALPYRLRPAAETLVLEPRGGFDVLVALAEGARHVTAIEANPLIVEAVEAQGSWAGDLYHDSRVTPIIEDSRSYVRRTQDQYDVVVLSLTSPQRPVTSGAYSLSEDHRYTAEAFDEYLARLNDGGLLVVTRWLQMPPSESIRAFALAVEALERAGGDPRVSIVALRSYQQMLIVVKRGTYDLGELEAVREFANSRAFDLVYIPGISAEDTNRFNVLQEPIYHRVCSEIVHTTDRGGWYDTYDFDVRPPSDDRPFFDHFFTWRQAPDMLMMAGTTWQPFGGAGYLVVLALLALAIIAAGGSILLPLAVRRRHDIGRPAGLGAYLMYFALLGLAFLLVEIPLFQQFILLLGQPAYAMATVLFALLIFSGIGSLISTRVPIGFALGLVPLVVGLYAVGLPTLL